MLNSRIFEKSKKMNKNSTSSGGERVLGLLGVAFIVLKLTGVINWSWWWVTAPFWGGFALFLVVAIIFGIIFLIATKG